MKKRLRKKKHYGEFTEFGFNIEILLNEGLTDEAFEAFVYDFIGYAYDLKGLECGGGGDPKKLSFFVAQPPRKPIAETDRDTLVSWVKARGEVQSAEAGPLVDAWR